MHSDLSLHLAAARNDDAARGYLVHGDAHDAAHG